MSTTMSIKNIAATVQIVYFHYITCPGLFTVPRIKIGETSDPPKRLKDHAKSKHGVRFNIQELCVIRGDRTNEQQILRYFKPFAVEGETEYFNLADELIEYIRWLRDQYYVWVPDDDVCPKIQDLDIVQSLHWMPNNERRKKPSSRYRLFEDSRITFEERKVTIDDFYTAEPIINAAREAMGSIDLDPASHVYANQNVKAVRFYTLEDDGLDKSWRGNVWCNPPFSTMDIWVNKIISELKLGDINQLCLLCATRTLTAKYFAPIHAHADAVCVFKGRIKFWGKIASTPDDGHAVFYFGNNKEGFKNAFSELGHVYYRA